MVLKRIRPLWFLLLIFILGCGSSNDTLGQHLPSAKGIKNLPQSATDVTRWKAGAMHEADFTVTESDFLLTYSNKFALSEAAPDVFPKPMPIHVRELALDASGKRDYSGNRFVVTNGWCHRTRFGNGGGIEVIYCRDRGRGFYRSYAR